MFNDVRKNKINQADTAQSEKRYFESSQNLKSKQSGQRFDEAD